MAQQHRLSWAQVRVAVLDCGVLAIACLATYWLSTYVLSPIHPEPRADEMLGGLWAVIATVFVCRFSYDRSTTAAISRMAATSVSFVICLIYLIFLPFHAWALAVLIGVSALVATLIGRPGDAITAGITTAVVMVVAGVSPHDAWQQPILRFADTVIGVAIGVAAAWAGLRVIHPVTRLPRPPGGKPAEGSSGGRTSA
jgi:ABC-type thiamin/hydroxymethylpyrimidine transport system permease subunit